MGVEEVLLSLASTAGQTVVTAAAADTWKTVKRAFARLLGRGDPARTELAERRLEQIREDLTSVQADQLERVQDRLIVAWQARLLDLLEEHPEIAGELQVLVGEVQAQLRAGVVSIGGQGVTAGRDVSISASGGGISAGTIQGNVTSANPTGPGPANQ